MIPQTTLSNFMNGLNVKKVKLMKMDIEDFEYEAILGSKDLITWDVIENIALELHPSILSSRGKSQQHIFDFLHSVGYIRNPKYETLIMSRDIE